MKRRLCHAAGMFEAEYEKGCCILPQNEESPYETASNRHTVKAPYCEITTVRAFLARENALQRSLPQRRNRPLHSAGGRRLSSLRNPFSYWSGRRFHE